MKLSLARWESNGSSSGHWMVRQLPGVSLIRSTLGYWTALSNPCSFAYRKEHTLPLWGEDFTHTDLSCLPTRRFSSRAAAMAALEAAFSPAAPTALAEAVS